MIEGIANDPIYKEQYKLNSKEVQSPSLLQKDDELFYGIWGQIFNRYAGLRANQAYQSLYAWKQNFYDDKDARFYETKSKNPAEAPPKPAKYPKRFFIVTSNIDGEAIKAGFSDSDIYETRGNIMQWQCCKPCTKNAFFNVEEDFRFEVNKATGRATPVKYVDVKAKKASTTPTLQELQTFRYKQLISNENDVGDEQGFNFAEPHGSFTDEQKPLQGTQHRSMYFRYFAPFTAEQLSDSNTFMLPGNKMYLKSIHSSGALLRKFNSSIDLKNERGECVNGSVLRHDVSMEFAQLNGIPEQGPNDLFHLELHEMVFAGMAEKLDECIVDIRTVDPMIHHHNYVTTIDSEKLVQVSGSNSLFTISMQVFNASKGEIPIHVLTHQAKPAVRRQNPSNGTYYDTFVIDISSISPDDTKNIMPMCGTISLVVEPLRAKKLYTQPYGSVGKSCRTEDRPWQLFGEYDLSTLTKTMDALQTHRYAGKNDTKMIDFVMGAKDDIHELKLRAVQHNGMQFKCIYLFINVPISNYKAPQVDDVVIPIPSPSNLISQADMDQLTNQQPQAKKPEAAETKKPAINRITCHNCHFHARPRIKMQDDKTWIKTVPSKYKAWSTAAIKEIKDSGRSLLILELGCEPNVSGILNI